MLSVNERSTMLASSLLERGGDVDLTEDLSKVMENLRYVLQLLVVTLEPKKKWLF